MFYIKYFVGLKPIGNGFLFSTARWHAGGTCYGTNWLHWVASRITCLGRKKKGCLVGWWHYGRVETSHSEATTRCPLEHCRHGSLALRQPKEPVAKWVGIHVILKEAEVLASGHMYLSYFVLHMCRARMWLFVRCAFTSKNKGFTHCMITTEKGLHAYSIFSLFLLVPSLHVFVCVQSIPLGIHVLHRL